MPQSKPAANVTVQALRALALHYPETEEAIACQGTALEKSSFKARSKAFLFLGGAGASFNVMVKLRVSLAEATELAAKQPGCYKVGAHGWVTAAFDNQSPPPGLLERWIDESYRLLAPRSLLALLPEGGPPAPGASKKQGAKKKGS